MVLRIIIIMDMFNQIYNNPNDNTNGNTASNKI